MIDGVEHWAAIPPVQYEFKSMRWVPEPSTIALQLIALVCVINFPQLALWLVHID